VAEVDEVVAEAEEVDDQVMSLHVVWNHLHVNLFHDQQRRINGIKKKIFHVNNEHFEQFVIQQRI